jgi:hypothetical protein
LKYACKECGTGYREHGRRKNYCKECGTGYCEHGRLKHRCKECGTKNTRKTGKCEHGRRKSLCKDCLEVVKLNVLKQILDDPPKTPDAGWILPLPLLN